MFTPIVVAGLQRALNRFPGIFIKVDRIPGDRATAAVKDLSGHYLQDVPRCFESLQYALCR